MRVLGRWVGEVSLEFELFVDFEVESFAVGDDVDICAIGLGV